MTTPYYEKYKVAIPEGTSGDWRVEHLVVSEADADRDRTRAIISQSGRFSGRFVRPGTYTMLYHKGSLWMSDTPDEIRDHLSPIHEAERQGGHILINGLGIGMVAAAILRLPAVTKVTVIELCEDVIKLVGPALKEEFGDKLEIIQADAYEFKPPKGIRYGVVWHDIWKDLCTDNLKEMGKLHRRYGRRTEWQGSWGKELLQSYRRQERSQGW